MKKVISTPVAFTIVTILAILIGGFLIWQTLDIDETETLNLVEEQKEDEFSDWKTYRNEEIGFEFKYPLEWIFFNDNTEISENNSIRLEIEIANSDYPLRPTDQELFLMIQDMELIDKDILQYFIDSTICSGSSEFEEIKLKTIEGCKIMNIRRFSEGSGGYNQRNMWGGYFLARDNRYLYTFQYIAGLEVYDAEDIFSKIISTLKSL